MGKELRIGAGVRCISKYKTTKKIFKFDNIIFLMSITGHISYENVQFEINKLCQKTEKEQYIVWHFIGGGFGQSYRQILKNFTVTISFSIRL